MVFNIGIITGYAVSADGNKTDINKWVNALKL
jgi:hypothetical protein